MRLLLYSWNANNERMLADNLIKLGYEIVWFQKECKHYTRDMELALEMIQSIHAEGVEAVVSFNYYPIISMICNTCQIPYYAWVYDCPHFTLYAKQIALPGSHIGIFDREMVRHLEEDYDITTVYHAPLSTDAEYFDSVIGRASRKEREKYQCDVSFVGSLYTGEYNYYDMLFFHNADGSDYCDTIDALIQRQCFSYKEDYLEKAVTAGQVDLAGLRKSMEEQGLMLGEDYFAKPEDILMEAVLEKKVTVEERRRLLTAIAVDAAGGGKQKTTEGLVSAKYQESMVRSAEGKGIDRKYDFRLYTGSDTGRLPALHARNHGRVDYQTQMPLVFAGSRINLNISLRSIHSGIPLRVLDIMACGGFVLSNCQPEITEYFEEGVEIVTFSSLEECMDKVRYYLSHEEERVQIAEAGRRKVKNDFSYEAGLSRLFEV